MNMKLVKAGDVSRADADKLLDVLDQMQIAWFETFKEEPQFCHTYNWNVCKTLWKTRDSGEDLEKNKLIDWRNSGAGKPLIGENNARKFVDWLIEKGFLEKYDLPSAPRVIFVRPTAKLIESLDRMFSIGVVAAKKAFG